MATVFYASSSEGSSVEFDFLVSPKSVVTEIAANYKNILAVKAVNTITRAVEFIDMPILSCVADTTNGVITVVASAEEFPETFFVGTTSASATLFISDGNINISSDYVSLHKKRTVIPNNEIWYKATEKIELYSDSGFGATFVSNKWDNRTGEGVITFDGDVTTIREYAFEKCTSLQSVTIPNSVKTIGYSAFQKCISLQNVNIPDGVTTIEGSAFEDCTSFESITLPNSVNSIGHSAFAFCTSLKSVTFSDIAPTISPLAFADCENLEKFYGKFASDDNRCLIVDGVLKLVAPAYLTSYTIPNEVTTIGNYAFNNCVNIENLTIPNSVTKIESNAFYECYNLLSITIPDSVNTIEPYAFFNCANLQKIYLKAAVPPTLTNYIIIGNLGCSQPYIYVPVDAVDTYKTANYWKDYADIIVGYNFGE